METILIMVMVQAVVLCQAVPMAMDIMEIVVAEADALVVRVQAVVDVEVAVIKQTACNMRFAAMPA